MAVLSRMMVIAYGVLTVVFVCLYFYFQAAERERKEADLAGDIVAEDRLAAHMNEFRPKLLRRLFWAVYGVPTLLGAVIIYVVNFA